VQVGQLAAFSAIGVEVVADREQPCRPGVAHGLQPEMFFLRQCCNVPPDVRVDALVDQRDLGCVSDKPERWVVDDAGIHGGAPFDGQAKPELWLCT
jgi:hypothetical protein